MTETYAPVEAEILSAKQIAERLGIHRRTLHNWTNARRIPFFRVGGRILFRWDRVLEALDDMEVAAKTSA